jgi:hypothetical protein
MGSFRGLRLVAGETQGWLGEGGQPAEPLGVGKSCGLPDPVVDRGSLRTSLKGFGALLP